MSSGLHYTNDDDDDDDMDGVEEDLKIRSWCWRGTLIWPLHKIPRLHCGIGIESIRRRRSFSEHEWKRHRGLLSLFT